MSSGPNITNFGPELLRLAVALSYSAFTRDFSKWDGELLYSHNESTIREPAFFIYKYQGNLWIINRGSLHPDDYLTCAEIGEIETPIGTFHEGFYNAALYCYFIARKYILKLNGGTVYFTGHSYGASVAPINYILFQNEFPKKDGGVLSFAPMPMISSNLSIKYFDKIASFVNNYDIVPTISVVNVYERFKLIYPIFDDLNETKLINFLESFLNYFEKDTNMSIATYMQIKIMIPELVDAIVGYAQRGDNRTIRFPPGHTYHVFVDKSKPLPKSEVDATTTFTKMSIDIHSIQNHDIGDYIEIMNQLPDKKKKK